MSFDFFPKSGQKRAREESLFPKSGQKRAREESQPINNNMAGALGKEQVKKARVVPGGMDAVLRESVGSSLDREKPLGSERKADGSGLVHANDSTTHVTETLDAARTATDQKDSVWHRSREEVSTVVCHEDEQDKQSGSARKHTPATALPRKQFRSWSMEKLKDKLAEVQRELRTGRYQSRSLKLHIMLVMLYLHIVSRDPDFPDCEEANAGVRVRKTLRCLFGVGNNTLSAVSRLLRGPSLATVASTDGCGNKTNHATRLRLTKGLLLRIRRLLFEASAHPAAVVTSTNVMWLLRKLRRLDYSEQTTQSVRTARQAVWRALQRHGFVTLPGRGVLRHRTSERHAAARDRFIHQCQVLQDKGFQLWFCDEGYARCVPRRAGDMHADSDEKRSDSRVCFAAGVFAGWTDPETGKVEEAQVDRAGNEPILVLPAVLRARHYHSHFQCPRYRQWFKTRVSMFRRRTAIVMDCAAHHTAPDPRISRALHSGSVPDLQAVIRDLLPPPPANSSVLPVPPGKEDRVSYWRAHVRERLRECGMESELAQFARSRGHAVLLIPPHLPELQAAQLVFSRVKRYVASKFRVGRKFSEVESQVLDGFAQVRNKEVAHAMELVGEWMDFYAGGPAPRKPRGVGGGGVEQKISASSTDWGVNMDEGEGGDKVDVLCELEELLLEDSASESDNDVMHDVEGGGDGE